MYSASFYQICIDQRTSNTCIKEQGFVSTLLRGLKTFFNRHDCSLHGLCSHRQWHSEYIYMYTASNASSYAPKTCNHYTIPSWTTASRIHWYVTTGPPVPPVNPVTFGSSLSECPKRSKMLQALPTNHARLSQAGLIKTVPSPCNKQTLLLSYILWFEEHKGAISKKQKGESYWILNNDPLEDCCAYLGLDSNPFPL